MPSLLRIHPNVTSITLPFPQLQEIGIAANKPAAAQFPNMSTQTGPWMQTNARFKVEGGQMTTQLGQGKAINIFNQNIVDFTLIPKGGH